MFYKPHLHRSYYILTVPDSNEIQLQSEGRTLRLCPDESSDILKRLLPLLDGTHTVDDILHNMSDCDKLQIIDSLQRLDQAHLLEDSAAPTAPLSNIQHQFYNKSL